MEKTRIALEVNNLWYRYNISQQWVLKNVNFFVREGETVAIVGPFGCGKTTLFRVLTGIAEKVYGGELRGEIRIFGKPISEYNSKELTRHIGILFQNPMLQFIEYVVEDDLYSFAEKYYSDHNYIERQIETVLDFFGIKKLRKKRVFELSGGELRKVAIAKLMILKPRILLMDEPLLWLDQRGVGSFLKLLNILKSLGLTIVISEHRVLPLIPFVDKIVIMDNGRISSIKDVKKILKDNVKEREYVFQTNRITAGVNNILENYPIDRLVASKCMKDLCLENVWFKYSKRGPWVLREVNFSAKLGELVVILGDNGSGKTTLLKIISGMLKPTRGKVSILGYNPAKKKDEVYFVPQVHHVSFSEETVFDEVAKIVCTGKNKHRNCKELVIKILEQYGLVDKLYESPYNLSWGQQLLLNIVLAILSKRKIILFDEPTTGLSYADKIAIARIIRRMGSLRILTTHDVDFAAMLKPSRLYMITGGKLYLIDVGAFIERTIPIVKSSYELLKNILGEKLVGDIDVLDLT